MSPAASTARVHRAAYDVGVYGVAQVLSAALALVLLGWMGRALGSAGFGEFSFAFVLASLGGLIADFGMGPWITRAAAQDPAGASTSLSGVLRLRLRTVALAWALTLGFASWYVADAARLTEIAILLVYVTTLGYVVVHESLLMGRGRAGWVSLSVGGGKALELAAVVGYLASTRNPTVIGVAVALAAACIVRLAVVATAARAVLRRERQGVSLDAAPAAVAAAHARPLWRQVLPFAVGSVLWTTYFKVDVLLLERMVTRSDLGLYTAAYRVLEALLLVPRSLVGVLYPVIAEAWSRNALGGGILSRPARALFAFAAAAAAGLAVLAPDVLRFLFGPSFANGAPALVVLAAAMVPVFFNQYLGAVLTAIHRQGSWLLVTVGALIVNVAANLLLIPRLGFVGAAWATLVSETGMLVALALLVVPRHGPLFSLGWLVRALVAAGAMAVSVHFLPLGLVPRIAVGALLFFMLALVLRVVLPEDGTLLRSAWRSRPASATASGPSEGA